MFTRKPTPYPQTPKASLIRAALWIPASLLFLDVGFNRIIDLRARGAYVNPFRYANVVFWILMILFLTYQAVVSLRRYRAESA